MPGYQQRWLTSTALRRRPTCDILGPIIRLVCCTGAGRAANSSGVTGCKLDGHVQKHAFNLRTLPKLHGCIWLAASTLKVKTDLTECCEKEAATVHVCRGVSGHQWAAL